jgi:tol-pal system protein YbgF
MPALTKKNKGKELWVTVASLVLPSFVFVAEVPAQSVVNVDARSLMTRLERIERRLMALEQKNFATTGQAGEASVADMELRLQEIENESTNLYGSVEQLGNAVRQLSGRLDKLMQDYEYRFQDVEKSLNQVPRAPAAPVAQPAPEAGNPSPAIETPAALIIPADAAPEEIYKQAYTYLTSAQYPLAQKWLETFLQRHKEHALADNAYYWLGEVYLVQGKSEDAIIAFKDGLTAFPEGRKAPGNLLKMGTAFEKLGQAHHARSAWRKLLKDYPGTPEAAKAREALGDEGQTAPAGAENGTS